MSLKRWNGTSWVVVAGSRPGATGAQGPTGPQGPAGTVSIGTTTVTTAGNPASVTNSGTYAAAILNFTIPQGPTGAQGTPGTPGTAGTRGTIIGSAQTDPVTFGVTGMINGDGFLNLSNGYYYVYNSSSLTWVLQGSLMGPSGTRGSTGPAGATGPTGPTSNVVVNKLQTQYNYWATDQILNLGIYYPKYKTLATEQQQAAYILSTALVM